MCARFGGLIGHLSGGPPAGPGRSRTTPEFPQGYIGSFRGVARRCGRLAAPSRNRVAIPPRRLRGLLSAAAKRFQAEYWDYRQPTARVIPAAIEPQPPPWENWRNRGESHGAQRPV